MLIPEDLVAQIIEEVRETNGRVSVIERNMEVYGYPRGNTVSWGINTENGCIIRAIRTLENRDTIIEINIPPKEYMTCSDYYSH